MDYSLTAEDKEKLLRLKNQNSPESRNSEPEYDPVEGYRHLNVLQGGNRYRIEYQDTSISIPGNSVHKIVLSNFIEDYLETRDFDEAHRRNYKTKGGKTEEFIPVFESVEDLKQDLSKLAEELDPRN